MHELDAAVRASTVLLSGTGRAPELIAAKGMKSNAAAQQGSVLRWSLGRNGRDVCQTCTQGLSCKGQKVKRTDAHQTLTFALIAPVKAPSLGASA